MEGIRAVAGEVSRIVGKDFSIFKVRGSWKYLYVEGKEPALRGKGMIDGARTEVQGISLADEALR